MEYNTNKNNVLDNKTGFLPEESITSSNSSQTKTELNHALAEKMIHLQKRKSTVVYFNALFYCAVFLRSSMQGVSVVNVSSYHSISACVKCLCCSVMLINSSFSVLALEVLLLVSFGF